MAGEPRSEKAGQYPPRRTRVTGAFDQEIRLGLRDAPINVIAAAIGLSPLVLRFGFERVQSLPTRGTVRHPAASFKRHSAKSKITPYRSRVEGAQQDAGEVRIPPPA